jgi:translation elongation factor EF-Ts
MELLSKKYTLNEINDISFIGFECVLNEETLLQIEEINNKVGSPNYVKTPIFNKRIKKNPNDVGFIKKNNDGMNQKKKIKEILNDDDWDLLSSFEVTKIEKKKGIDNEIVEIRSLLNMLTESNFNSKYDSIILILDKLIIFSLEEKNKMYNVIIDVTSGNSFYSEIYARLFSKISEKYKIMNELFFERIKLYLHNFEFVENVNNKESYDEICKKNKENDKSEAFSLFLVNLEKYNVIEKEVIINIIDHLLKKLLFYLKNHLYKSMVDKIIENLFILYKKDWVENILIKINDKDKVKTKMIDFIIGIVENIKVNIYPGISNKSKSYFKLIDILEK